MCCWKQALSISFNYSSSVCFLCVGTSLPSQTTPGLETWSLPCTAISFASYLLADSRIHPLQKDFHTLCTLSGKLPPKHNFALSQLCSRELLFSISTSEVTLLSWGWGRALFWELFEICYHLASIKFPCPTSMSSPCDSACYHWHMTALNWYFKLIDFLSGLLVFCRREWIFWVLVFNFLCLCLRHWERKERKFLMEAVVMLDCHKYF